MNIVEKSTHSDLQIICAALGHSYYSDRAHCSSCYYRAATYEFKTTPKSRFEGGGFYWILEWLNGSLDVMKNNVSLYTIRTNSTIESYELAHRIYKSLVISGTLLSPGDIKATWPDKEWVYE